MGISEDLIGRLQELQELLAARKKDYEETSKEWRPLEAGHIEDALSSLTAAVLELAVNNDD